MIIFFGKTLDKVRPGGIIAFITSKGTLDKENPSVRKNPKQLANANTGNQTGGQSILSAFCFIFIFL